jgi:GTP cyclohydrolase II
MSDPSKELTLRVHDECMYLFSFTGMDDIFFCSILFCFDTGNGSDVFGSDICTCKPYLTYAMEECIRTAQKGKKNLKT